MLSTKSEMLSQPYGGYTIQIWTLKLSAYELVYEVIESTEFVAFNLYLRFETKIAEKCTTNAFNIEVKHYRLM